jgi:hypothetical protein
MVKHDAVVKNSQLYVRAVQVIVDLLREFFPVANRVVRNVSNCSSNKPELFIVNPLAFDEFLNDAERITGLFSAFFFSPFVAGYRLAVLYLDC